MGLAKKFGLSTLVLAVIASAANALPAGGLPGWSGDVDFGYDGPDGRTLAGQVDYAVYDVVDYPGSAPSGGQYIYAYQIFNSSSSDVGVKSLSVCILEGADVGNINWDDYEAPDGIAPFLEYFSPDPQAAQSADFLFWPYLNGLVESGGHSVNLLFSSDGGPIVGFGLIEGGGVGGMIEGLPTPVPEPTTLVLLGIGGLITLTRKKR